jgi:hypothetical protein
MKNWSPEKKIKKGNRAKMAGTRSISEKKKGKIYQTKHKQNILQGHLGPEPWAN